MNVVNYLVICISLFILSTIKIYYIRKNFREKYPEVDTLIRNEETNWIKELYMWLQAFFVITMPILNLIYFIYVFTKTEEEFENDWKEDFNLS